MWAASKTWESPRNDSSLEPPKQWALTTLRLQSCVTPHCLQNWFKPTLCVKMWHSINRKLSTHLQTPCSCPDTHRGSLWGVKKRVLPAEWHQELLAGSGATTEVVLMLALPWHFTSLLPGPRCRDYLFLFPVFSALSHCSPRAAGSRMRLYHWS